MKRLLTSILIVTSAAASAETIKLFVPNGPSHPTTPSILRVLDVANASQNKYTFVIDFKPGGNQTIALKEMDKSPQNTLATIAPAYVENIETGVLNESDYVPVSALGDACWAVVANRPLTGQKEMVIGGVGFGNSAHLTGLALGEKYNFKTEYIVFKSNFDALVNMAGNNGINLAVDKYENYASLKTKNPDLQMVAASCPTRLPQEPTIKTLKELGVNVPSVFIIAMASSEMHRDRRTEISTILDSAINQLGEKEIYQLSALRPPVFDGVSTEAFYKKSLYEIRTTQARYKEDLARYAKK
jgi:tripartite-type tricarboxylate transporter receptor subunit TctC